MAKVAEEVAHGSGDAAPAADRPVDAPPANRTLTEDERQLAALGYKQELSRAWSGFTNFAISFTIISVLAGTFTTFAFAWQNGGPIAVSIGWPVLCGFVLMVAFSMAELTSRYPTAGGPYWWAHDLGGKGWSWMTGWFNIVGLVGIVASVGYGCAFFLFNLLQLYGVDVIGIDFGDAKHILGETWLLFAIILILYTLVNIFADRILALMNNVSVGWHLVGVAIVIALLVFVPDHHQGAKFIFIIATVGQFFCGAAGLTSASRTWYAFSRDRGMPGWGIFRRVNRERVPFNAVIAVSVASAIIAIPALFGKNDIPFAFFALTGICTVGLYLAYIIPVYLRLRRGDDFEAGPWTLGKRYKIVNVLAIIFVILVVYALNLPY